MGLDSTTETGAKILKPESGLRCSVIVATNDDSVLQGTLLKSPDEELHQEVILKRGYASASEAYNAGMAEAKGEILIFVHQDVYLPEGWTAALGRALQTLSEVDPIWGVLGVFGAAKQGDRQGHVYSTGLGLELGEEFALPKEAVSLDELLLITRRAAGLRFDERLPGFHLYGTDICLEAARRGMKSYIIPAFCIHNSNGLSYLPKAFWRAYFYLRDKWRDQLPVQTSCTTITRGYGPVVAAMKTGLMKWVKGEKVGQRSVHPDRLYKELRNSGMERNS